MWLNVAILIPSRVYMVVDRPWMRKIRYLRSVLSVTSMEAQHFKQIRFGKANGVTT
jgi:hypothetical protein